jgi:sugar/nucleoside kinase (ribokinase family)
VIGDDGAGRFMLDGLRRRGIDVGACRIDPAQPTGLTVVLSRGDDRAILTARGTMSALTAADVSDELLAATDHLHVSSPFLQDGLLPTLAGLFERAHAAGATTSLDPGWDPRERWETLDAALGATDVFLPNAAEACRIAGEDEPAQALAALARRIGTVVVKLGAEGAIARRGDEAVQVSAPSVHAVDATGAGDSFTAGFLHGGSLEEALRLGVACGALSTRSLGGVDAQPLLAEALELAATLRTRAIASTT